MRDRGGWTKQAPPLHPPAFTTLTRPVEIQVLEARSINMTRQGQRVVGINSLGPTYLPASQSVHSPQALSLRVPHALSCSDPAAAATQTTEQTTATEQPLAPARRDTIRRASEHRNHSRQKGIDRLQLRRSIGIGFIYRATGRRRSRGAYRRGIHTFLTSFTSPPPFSL